MSKEKKITKIYSLSPMQEGMLYHSLLDKESNAYFCQGAFSLGGNIDVPLFRESLNILVQRYEILRTLFIYENVKQPLQMVLEKRDFKMDFSDISGCLPGEKEQLIEELKQKDMESKFDLSKDHLMRILLLKTGNDSFRLIWSFHHILMDGWCLGLLFKDVIHIYMSLKDGKSPALSQVTPYSNYIQWLKKQDREEAADYWQKYLQGYDETACLPAQKTQNPGDKYKLQTYDLIFNKNEDESLIDRLRKISAENHVTLNTLFQTLWGLLLQKYNNTDDVVFGAVVSGRSSEIVGVEHIVGLFINTVPVRIKSREYMNFICLLEQVQQQAVFSRKYEYLTLAQIQSNSLLGRNLLQHIMAFENYPLHDESAPAGQAHHPGFWLEDVAFYDQTHYDFCIIIVPRQPYVVKFNYNSRVYETSFIERAAGQFYRLLKQIAADPLIGLDIVDIVPAKEKDRILYEFNNTQAEYPLDKTIPMLFVEQTDRTPDNAALIFNDKVLTYKELDNASSRVVVLLTSKGVQQDTIAAVLFERSIAMLVAILGILKSGGAYLPIHPQHPRAHIEYIIKNSQAKILLAHPGYLEDFAGSCETILMTDQGKSPDDGNKNNNRRITPAAQPHHLAYVIYTSGSTGRPKGVMIEQRSLVNRLNWMQRVFRLDSDHTLLQKTSYTFDVSVWELLWGFLVGARLCLLPPGGEKDPQILVETIARNRVTIVHFVPNMLKLFLEYVRDTKNGPNISNIIYVISSGEALNLSEVLLFNELLHTPYKTKLSNLYGPTECTIDVSYFDCTPKGEWQCVPIGKPIDNIRLLILDKEKRLQPIGAPGELAAAGIGLARGYLNNPELTAEKFVSNNNKSYKSYRTYRSYFLKKIYKTGDLVRWLHDGNIEFLGRIDNQVKIRGSRIELGEIENRLREYEGVKEAAVIARAAGTGDTYLCAYIVGAQHTAPSTAALREFLTRTLPDYMIPQYFVPLETIPRTASGKIDKNVLPLPGIGIGEDYTAPRNITERILVEIWSEILNKEKNKIGIDANFFELGGHSLKAITLMLQVHKRFDVELQLAEIFKNATIRGLANIIAVVKEGSPLPGENEINRKLSPAVQMSLPSCPRQIDYSSIYPVEKKEYYPQSSAQKRLFFINRFGDTGTSFNMPNVLKVEGKLDIERLSGAVKDLVNRHESFRTVFGMIDDKPVQQVLERVDFNIYSFQPGADAIDREIKKIIDKFVQPFDLSQAALLRIGYIKQAEDDYILLIDVHHIISDGTSLGVIVDDFVSLYLQEELPAVRIRYKDFSTWQNGLLAAKRIEHQESYWKKLFSNEIPRLNLLTADPPPEVFRFAGANYDFVLAGEEAVRFKSFASQGGVTLYIRLLAVLNILLYKYTGQEDIVIGTGITGRHHVDLQNIVGMFVNMLAMRNYPCGDKRYGDFLEEVKDNSIQAFENQDVQFEYLIENLNIERSSSLNPLFNTVLAVQNFEFSKKKLAGITFTPYEYKNTTAKFDLTLFAKEVGEDIHFSFEYCAALFSFGEIERLSRHLLNVIRRVSENPAVLISQIGILSEAEQRQLLFEFNRTEAGFSTNKTIHGLYEEQVMQTPFNTALCCRDKQITYGELNKKSDRLAGSLHEKGVKAGNIIAVMMEPSLEMVVGLLAILKSGGAYLAIDPACPEERKKYILRDSDAKISIADSSSKAQIDHVTHIDYFQDFIQENDINDELSETGRALDPKGIPPSLNIMYVIYTSGSTGKPKGVLIRHEGFINLVSFHQKVFGDGCNTRMSQVANPGFDALALEVWPCLSSGASLHIAPDEIRSDPVKMKEWLIRDEISNSFQSTIMAEWLLKQEWPEKGCALRILRTGGDKLTCYPAKGCPFALYNLYGPTEDTVFTTCSRVETHAGNLKYPHIGKPIDNKRVYILGPNLELQPIKVAGELCIAGKGLAIGYLNHPALTAEKFVLNHNRFYKSYKSYMMYRTGDLARRLPDGNIDYLGRIDNQVKIRGYRIELEEIKKRLLEHDAVKEAFVVVKTDGEQSKYLTAYYVEQHTTGSKPVNTGLDLKNYLSRVLPRYMVPHFFIRLEKIPLTANGKINIKALPNPRITSAEIYIAPANEIEKKLVGIWSKNLKIPGDRISVTANFFDLGGHSLNAALVIGEIHKILNVKVPLVKFFEIPDIRSLSAYIKDSEKTRYAAIKPVEKKDYYILSSQQKRLFILQQLNPASIGYNIPFIIPLTGEIEKKLYDALRRLLERHESLRTYFVMIDGAPVQEIELPSALKITIEKFDLSNSHDISKVHVEQTKEEIIKKFVRPFDLSTAPLLRVGVLRNSDSQHILICDMHHIISDGMSQNILENDFTTLYSEGELSSLRLQYRDYSEWQNSQEQDKFVKRQEAYWLTVFPDEIPVIDIPPDYPRPIMKSFAGAVVSFEINEKETYLLKDTARQLNATLNMICLAIFNIVLAKLGGQEDIIVGMPIAGRRYADLERIIGMFVNTLAVRNYPSAMKTVEEFFYEVKKEVSAVYENQEYQFEDLVDKISLQRDTAHNPVFDVMFNFVNFLENTDSKRDLINKICHVHREGISKFDLTLTAVDFGERLIFNVEYCKKLFKSSTIDRFISYFKRAVSLSILDLSKRISDIEIIPDREKKQILYEFNGRKFNYPGESTVHELFESQVEKTPFNIALKYKDEHITYGRLNKRADRLAAVLQAKGIKTGIIAAVILDPSIDMPTALLAVLKSGGAYLPIEPTYPEERKKYMLRDSGATFLIGDSCTHYDVDCYIDINDKTIEPGDMFEMGNILQAGSDIKTGKDSTPANGMKPAHIVYVIYTSGTTGLPKGVILEHSSLVNTLLYRKSGYRLNITDICMQLFFYSFDGFAASFFTPIISGAVVVLLHKSEMKNPIKMKELIIKNRVTHFISVPALYHAVIDILSGEEAASLRIITLAGDRLSTNVLEITRQKNRNIEIVNEYGVTEAAVLSTIYRRQERSGKICIGKPIANTRIYIMNKNNGLQPLGCAGELCISGLGTARGYLNSNSLTGEKFMPDPYRPGEKMYKTGDLARWLPDGNIEYMGRVGDDQIKVRGFRIELGEIENRLKKHEAVKDAVVLLRDGKEEEKFICAYFVPGRESTVPGLREYLFKVLPDYMMPAYIIQVECIPLTANGKIDRKSLPAPDVIKSKEYVPPGSEIEKKLVEIWSQVLGIDKTGIGIKTNYFDIGGNSLNIMKMNARVKEVFKRDIPLDMMFRLPHVKSLAKYIKNEDVKDQIADEMIAKSQETLDETLDRLQGNLR